MELSYVVVEKKRNTTFIYFYLVYSKNYTPLVYCSRKRLLKNVIVKCGSKVKKVERNEIVVVCGSVWLCVGVCGCVW